MKKTYMKPEVYVESFQMVDHIAAGCVMDISDTGELSGIPHYLRIESCSMGYNEDAIQFFTSTTINNVCQIITDESSVECYNSFNDPEKMFSS